jgi:hypothetical protein
MEAELKVVVSAAPDGVAELLKNHPEVEAEPIAGSTSILFHRGDWKRELRLGDPTLEVSGLTELIDNNPLVCADVASVPDAASTLALIGIGPVAFAGMVSDQPTILTNAPVNEEVLQAFLANFGLSHPAIIHHEDQDLGSVYAATLLIPISNPEEWSEIDDLFEERYSRSFFVRRDEASEWDTKLVANKPFAVYRLGLTPGDDTSLLTVRVLADKHGKCGEAQLVHALNVMCGFEEMLATTLG